MIGHLSAQDFLVGFIVGGRLVCLVRPLVDLLLSAIFSQLGASIGIGWCARVWCDGIEYEIGLEIIVADLQLLLVAVHLFLDARSLDVLQILCG